LVFTKVALTIGATPPTHLPERSRVPPQHPRQWRAGCRWMHYHLYHYRAYRSDAWRWDGMLATLLPAKTLAHSGQQQSTCTFSSAPADCAMPPTGTSCLATAPCGKGMLAPCALLVCLTFDFAACREAEAPTFLLPASSPCHHLLPPPLSLSLSPQLLSYSLLTHSISVSLISSLSLSLQQNTRMLLHKRLPAHPVASPACCYPALHGWGPYLGDMSWTVAWWRLPCWAVSRACYYLPHLPATGALL